MRHAYHEKCREWLKEHFDSAGTVKLAYMSFEEFKEHTLATFGEQVQTMPVALNVEAPSEQNLLHLKVYNMFSELNEPQLFSAAYSVSVKAELSLSDRSNCLKPSSPRATTQTSNICEPLPGLETTKCSAFSHELSRIPEACQENKSAHKHLIPLLTTTTAHDNNSNSDGELRNASPTLHKTSPTTQTHSTNSSSKEKESGSRSDSQIDDEHRTYTRASKRTWVNHARTPQASQSHSSHAFVLFQTYMQEIPEEPDSSESESSDSEEEWKPYEAVPELTGEGHPLVRDESELFGSSPLARPLLVPRGWAKQHWAERFPCLTCGSRHHQDCSSRSHGNRDKANQALKAPPSKINRTWLGRTSNANDYRARLVTQALVKHPNTVSLFQLIRNIKAGDPQVFTLKKKGTVLNHMQALSRNIVFSKARWLAAMMQIPNFRGCTLQNSSVPIQCLDNTLCVHALVTSDYGEHLTYHKLMPDLNNAIQVPGSNIDDTYLSVCLFEGARSNNIAQSNIEPKAHC